MALLDKFKKLGSVLTPLRGNKPKSTLVKDVKPVNDTFTKGTYQDYVLNTERAKDITGN